MLEWLWFICDDIGSYTGTIVLQIDFFFLLWEQVTENTKSVMLLE